MSRDAPTCADFDERADELAVGGVAEPERGPLFAHAARCTRCATLLEELSSVADRLLLLAPEVDPPAGFEARAVARMTGEAPAAARRRPRWAVLVAAAALVVALAGGALIDRAVRGSGPAGAVRRGSLVSDAGHVIGSVEVWARPRPHVLVAVDYPEPGSATVACELDLPGGRRVVVGHWSPQDIASGVWTVGIDAALTRATAMEVVTADGQVLATAALS